MTHTEALRQRLADEADLCRNDGADDIAALLDEARAALAVPSVPSGEPVAWYLPAEGGDDSMFRDHRTVIACTGNKWDGWIPLYITPQPAPAGWQLVPVVPTHAMVRAWRSQSPGGRFHEESWIAMLDAAPTAPGA